MMPLQHLSYSQVYMLDRLCRPRLSRWGENTSVSNRTMLALQRHGLVKTIVRRDCDQNFQIEWRATYSGWAAMRRRRAAMMRAAVRGVR